MTGKSSPFRLTLKTLSVVCGLYIVLPLVAMILFSFSAKIEAIPTSFTVKWYTFNLSDMLTSVLNSMIVSLPAVAIALLFALPLSYAMARKKFAAKKLIDQLIVLPILIPGTVLGLSLIQLYNTGAFRGIPALLFLILAHVVVIIPVLARPVIAALEQSGTSVEEASKTLGAGPFKTLMRITFPIVMPNILVGVVFGLARSITDFVITLFLVPAGFLPMSTRIFNSTNYSIPQITSANAVVLLVMSLVIVTGAELLARKSR